MNRSLILIFSYLLFLSCSSKKKESKNSDSEISKIEYLEEKKSDTIQEPNYIAVFDKETESKSQLSNIEMKLINDNLKNAANKYNGELKNKKQTEKLNLRYYFRQYIVSKNEKDEKVVRVLCFCSYFGDWKNEIISVFDGGKCYLNAIINLTQNKTEYFGTNGEA